MGEKLKTKRAKFRVGDEAFLRVRVIKTDRRSSPAMVQVMGVARGWAMSDAIYEDELESLRERGPRRPAARGK